MEAQARENENNLLRAANLYAFAAKVLEVVSYIPQIKLSQENDIQLKSLLIPAMVLEVFSCELYLKEITKREGKSYKMIHNLQDLFLALEEETRKKIRNNVVRSMQVLQKDYTETEFDNNLESNKDNFIKWRYLEESLYADIHFVSELLKALQQHIETLKS